MDLTREQIGFRRGLEASYRGLRSQEFAEDAETCFKATGECCFEVPAVEARLAEVGEPMETRRGGALQIWLPPMPGKEYLVAVDTAGGGADGDFAAVQVIELESGMQCAELQQRLRTLELARVAAELAREYNGAMIAVERNNHGSGVLAYLEPVEQYARVYEQNGEAGWLTTAGSKPGMVSRMGALLVESPWMFCSRRLLGECRTFVAMAGGGTGAANGAHDDCLMAMAVAQAVRAELMVKKKDDVLPDGLLRGGRAFARLLTCLAMRSAEGLPLVGNNDPDQREGRDDRSGDDKVDTPRSGRPPPGGPSGRTWGLFCCGGKAAWRFWRCRRFVGCGVERRAS